MTPDDALKFWLEQSELMWSRVQTIAVIEASTLGAWYVLILAEKFHLARAILLVGLLLLIAVSLLMLRDGQYMNACEKEAGYNFPNVAKPFLGLKGRYIAFGIPLALALVNIMLLIFESALICKLG